MEIEWKSDRISVETSNSKAFNVFFHNEISMKFPTFIGIHQQFMEEFKKIVALSFIKAKKDNPLATSKTALAKIISKKITEGKEEGDERHYKTLSNYYEFYFHNGKKQTPTNTIINKLLSYLAYDSQKQFIDNQPSDLSYLEKVPFVDYQPKSLIKKEGDISDVEEDIEDGVTSINIKGNRGTLKQIIITISFIAIASLIYFIPNWEQKDCMTWKEDHYELASCQKSHDPKIIPIDEKLLKEFRKIKVDTSFTFFNDDGNALVWYYKSGGEIEFFNSKGTHPTENKLLKPVTQTIVRKYVFGEE